MAKLGQIAAEFCDSQVRKDDWSGRIIAERSAGDMRACRVNGWCVEKLAADAPSLQKEKAEEGRAVGGSLGRVSSVLGRLSWAVGPRRHRRSMSVAHDAWARLSLRGAAHMLRHRRRRRGPELLVAAAAPRLGPRGRHLGVPELQPRVAPIGFVAITSLGTRASYQTMTDAARSIVSKFVLNRLDWTVGNSQAADTDDLFVRGVLFHDQNARTGCTNRNGKLSHLAGGG